MTIPEDVKNTQDYEEGRVKHVKIAVQAAMNGKGAEASEGLNYVHRLVQRQVDAGADFVDLNVDEISLRPQEQKEAMQWLVRTVEEMCPIPLSVDSSNVETIQAGLESGDRRAGRILLNSASLERLEALDLAKLHDSLVIVTAAGESGMPQDDAERIANASQMVDAALDRGISIEDIFIDVSYFQSRLTVRSASMPLTRFANSAPSMAPIFTLPAALVMYPSAYRVAASSMMLLCAWQLTPVRTAESSILSRADRPRYSPLIEDREHINSLKICCLGAIDFAKIPAGLPQGELEV